MFGKNKIHKAKKGDGSNLDIVNIFPTIQGEGPYSGHPAIFIRLGGCNLQCEFCDTEFDNYQNCEIKDIIEQVTKFNKNKAYKLIVITGGEPLLQPIEKLCEKLIKLNYKVQIETNGTIFRKLHKDVDIICSPKNNTGKYKITSELVDFVDCFKFIISKTNKKYNSVPLVDCEKKIYIQPMDEYDEKKNQANMDFVVELAKKYGYIVSLQTHKYLKIE